MNKVIVDENNPDTYIISRLNNKKYTRITHTHTKKYGLSIDDYCNKFNVTRKDTVCKQLRNKLSWTKEKALEIYGEKLGSEKWNKYCEKQAITNTFEYKNKKYGITKEEFEQYNQKRANTKENFISRYGIEIGTKKWSEYCKRQAYAGCSLEYFIDLYGEEIGNNVYRELCNKKSNTLENFINRHGKIEGEKRYSSYIESRAAFFSNISQELFNKLKIPKNHKVYYATKNKEFSVYDKTNKNIYLYDYVDVTIKKGIEFNGDCFHANPEIYNENDTPNPFIKSLTSKDIWEVDKKKIDYLRIQRNIDILVIWERDYRKKPDEIIQKCNMFLGYE